MTKIVIIIPSRLNAKRLQNKPLKLINDKEMILHVHDVALKANIGDVFVATPDIEILNIYFLQDQILLNLRRLLNL